MAPHSSILAWKIPWTEEPGRLQSMRSLRVGLSLFTFMHWRRKWQPTPVLLPGESQGQRSLVGCRLWGRRVGHYWSDLAAAAAATLHEAVIWLLFSTLHTTLSLFRILHDFRKFVFWFTVIFIPSIWYITDVQQLLVKWIKIWKTVVFGDVAKYWGVYISNGKVSFWYVMTYMCVCTWRQMEATALPQDSWPRFKPHKCDNFPF